MPVSQQPPRSAWRAVFVVVGSVFFRDGERQSRVSSHFSGDLCQDILCTKPAQSACLDWFGGVAQTEFV